MDNNQTPKFDPETGRPLEPQAQQNAPKFDPMTGRPLEPQPAQNPQPTPKFDPETGRPLNQEPPQTQAQYTSPQPRPQEPYQQTPPQYAPPVQPTPAKTPADPLAIISLICGILSLVICCCLSWGSLVLGIAAIILAVVSKKGGKMSGLAVGGLICGIIGGGIALITIIVGIFFSSTGIYEDILHEFSDVIDGNGYYSYYN